MPAPDGFIPQAAAIPLRADPATGQTQVLLIRRLGRADWGIPKGHVDPGHTPAEAAANEALEEAGVEGDLSPDPLGSFTYDKNGDTCRVQVFALRVTAEHPRWEEQSIRQRQWFDADEAAATAAREAVSRLIRQAARENAP